MAPVEPKGMTPVVKTTAGWVKGLIILFGTYIIFYGHLTPGGGFAGGVIVALAFCMTVLSHGVHDAPRRLRLAAIAELDSIGGLMFLVIALLGVSGMLGGRFFTNYITKAGIGTPFNLISGGIIPLCNIAIGIKVASSLFLLFMLLVLLRVVYPGDEGAAKE